MNDLDTIKQALRENAAAVLHGDDTAFRDGLESIVASIDSSHSYMCTVGWFALVGADALHDIRRAAPTRRQRRAMFVPSFDDDAHPQVKDAMRIVNVTANDDHDTAAALTRPYALGIASRDGVIDAQRLLTELANVARTNHRSICGGGHP